MSHQVYLNEGISLLKDSLSQWKRGSDKKTGGDNKPMKNLMTYKPLTVLMVPTRPEGIAPMNSKPAMTFLGPYSENRQMHGQCSKITRLRSSDWRIDLLSTKGPTMIRTINVAQSEITLEFPEIEAVRQLPDYWLRVGIQDKYGFVNLPICAVVKWRSDLTASGMRGENANQDKLEERNERDVQNAAWIMKTVKEWEL